MKRVFIFLALLSIWHIAVHAQYYGNEIYKEGFDTENSLTLWTQENSITDNTSKWSIGGEPRYLFSEIDATSKSSAVFAFSGEGKPIVKMTSSEIDLSNKSNMLIGFYGYGLANSFPSGVTFLFRISKDNGITWTNLFDSRNDSYNGVKIKMWSLFKYNLPEEFNDKKVKVQFYADATATGTLYGMEGFIDGVFISERYRIEPEIIGLNYKNNALAAFSEEEPVTVEFINNGSEPINSIDLYFQVDNNAEIIETYAPLQPIATGEKASYTFKAKANLGTPLSTMNLKAGIRMNNDGDGTNNELIVSLNNIVAGIPYTPQFSYIEDGVMYVEPDEWKDIRKSGTVYWDISPKGWFVDHSKSTSDADCYLISRPVKLIGGKTYDLRFDAFTDGTTLSENQKNKMKIFVSTDKTASTDMNLLWENNTIDNKNARYTFVRYKAPKNGVFYFIFNCISPSTSNILEVENLNIREASNKDAGTIDITSPVNHPYTFTDQEMVSALIYNYGLSALPANQIKIHLKLNNENTVTETITQPIEPNKQITHTFNTKIDLSNVNTIRKLSVWTSLTGDEDLYNDTVICQMTSKVTGIPYSPDFGSGRVQGEECKEWTATDKNNDGFWFTPTSDVDLNSFVFAYGGGRVGATTIIVPTSDDELFSRPVKLEEGKQYKLTYLNRIENKNSLIPLTVNLYKVTETEKTFVKEVWKGDITSTNYQEMMHKIDIEATGIYELGFLVKHTEPISFKIRLGNFQLTQVFDVNLTLKEILFPATSISCYNSFPVGAVVKNNGKNTISSFILEGSSTTTGAVEKSVTGISIVPEETYTVYFDRNLTFSGSDNDVFKISLAVEGDKYDADNQASVDITYITPENIPVNSMLTYYRPEGWAMVNDNHDAYAFIHILGKGIIYNTEGKDIQADDRLITNCYSMQKDKLYTLEFDYGVNEGDTASFDTYIINGQSRINVVNISEVPGKAPSKNTFKGYFTVPEDGSYPVCFHLSDKTRSLIFNGKLRISEASTRPDIELIEILEPSKDTIYTKKESIKVKFKNTGKQSLSYIPFTCKVNDKEYYSKYPSSISTSNTTEYTVEFKDIDLYTPGKYEISITADVNEDANLEDNTLEKTINSLPIPDIALVGLNSPESGVLTQEETVTISIKNEGKGALSNIPVECSVSGETSNYAKTLTGVVAGPIADGETIQFSFEERINLYVEDRYNFNISAEVLNDVKIENNTKQVSVMSSHKELDTGVTAITSPGNNILGESEVVSIRVRNYSEVDLFEVPVAAEITHATNIEVSPQSITGEITYIKAGETTEYSFVNPVNMKVVGEYLIKVYTTLKNDININNDTIAGKIKSFKTDVGVTKIISPESGEELGSTEIIIEVKNLGEATVEAIPVRYKVGSMPQLGVINHTLATGESTTYSFPVKYDFTGYKVYTITAYTELDTDADKSNDSCTKQVENKPSDITSVSVNKASVYPNPNRGEFAISSGGTVLRSVLIYNIEGMLVARYDQLNSTVYQLDSNLPEGSYFVKVITSSGMQNCKLIINK